LLLLMIPLLPQSSAAISGNFRTLDLLVLRSDRIMLLFIESREDSMFAPPAQVGIQKLRFRVLKSYVGKPDGNVLRLDLMKIAGDVDPNIQPGDTVLSLREVNIDRGPYGEETLRWDYAFDLSNLQRTPSEYPLTRDFRVLHDGASILQVISRRMAMIRSRK